MGALSLSSAQSKPQAPARTNSDSANTLHNPQSVDGLAILTAALDSRHRIVSRHDCSHFVHDLYEQAGFHYEYASSTDLYAGVDEFRQVTNPQPGDLAVWRGHVGIVVNPSQHSFFSLLRSGPGIDLYNSPYWRHRGQPRFFRYVKHAPAVASNPIRNASWQPFFRAEEDEPATDDPEAGESASSPKKMPGRPQQATAPRAVLVNASKPLPPQVRDAFLQICKEEEPALSGRDLFNSSQSLVIYEELRVKKVRLSGNAGWADVEIDEPVSISGQKAQTRKRTEHQRWALTRRAPASWELTPAPNTIYISQAAAVHLLADELARLTAANDSSDPIQEKAQLARLLDALLEK